MVDWPLASVQIANKRIAKTQAFPFCDFTDFAPPAWFNV
jgi:hypothetical protein